MKVTHLTPYVSRRAGGMMDCTRGLVRSLGAEHDMDVGVLSVADAHSDADLPSWEGMNVTILPAAAAPEGFRFAPALSRALRRAEPDILHIHGLWTYLSVVGSGWVRRDSRKLIISPQGMLDAWALRNSALKKQVAAAVFERRHLRGASCLHAVSTAEAKSFRDFGLTNPICIIPNGVDLPRGRDAAADAPWAGKTSGRRKVLLFLSRLHPKKGLANLLQAWNEIVRDPVLNASEWILVVAGWDQGGHERQLRQQASELRIMDTVHFVGPVHGAARDAAYTHADAFVLPSFSEGLPLAVLEAWANCLPVIMTAECNVPEGFAAGAAIECRPETASVRDALRQLMQISDCERQSMGERGRQLVEERFTWNRIAAQMARVYRWLADGAARPEFVQVADR